MSVVEPVVSVLSPPPVGELLGLFVKSNPGSTKSRVETAGRAAAALGGAAVKLTAQQQRRVVAHKDEIADIIVAALAELDAGVSRASDGVGDDDSGEGLGDLLDVEIGRNRLNIYATSIAIEDWAGPVAGSTDLERNFCISRSTLHGWQQKHAVVGLLNGVRKHVFPLAQFIERRPVEGLQPVVRAAGSPRAAWLWLMQPHPSLGNRSPLDRLKAGCSAQVGALADRDFGQS